MVDQFITKKHVVAQSRVVSVWTPHPVSVGVGCQVANEVLMKLQAIVNGTPEIAKNTLVESIMGLPRIMHMKTYLLNYISDIQMGEGQVLESTIKVVVVAGVGHT